MTISDDESYII